MTARWKISNAIYMSLKKSAEALIGQKRKASWRNRQWKNGLVNGIPGKLVLAVERQLKHDAFDMSKVEAIQTAIESLSENEYSRLKYWFSEKDSEKWDRQIEVDSESGKLDFLVKEAHEESSN